MIKTDLSVCNNTDPQLMDMFSESALIEALELSAERYSGMEIRNTREINQVLKV